MGCFAVLCPICRLASGQEWAEQMRRPPAQDSFFLEDGIHDTYCCGRLPFVLGIGHKQSRNHLAKAATAAGGSPRVPCPSSCN